MAKLLRAAPYADDEKNLPVDNVATAITFYEQVLGFHVASRTDSPIKRVALCRDEIEIGLAENGGDPSQEGCFFEVDSVEDALAELQANGLGRDDVSFRIDQHGSTSYKVFFVVAPDGLCFCYGERVES